MASWFATEAASGEMSAGDLEAKQHLVKAGCIEGVIKALQAHGDSELVADAACELFQSMAAGSNEVKQGLLKSGCIAAVQKIVAAHGDNSVLTDSYMYVGLAFEREVHFVLYS